MMPAAHHFIDTNVFLRHVLADSPDQSPRARDLFAAVEAGERTVWTTRLVIAELVFVLQGQHYQLERDKIASILLPLIELPNVKVPQKGLMRDAFDLYTRYSIDFIDCYHAAAVRDRGQRVLLSYDRDFDKIGGLERVEP